MYQKLCISMVLLMQAFLLTGCGIVYRMPTGGMKPTISPNDALIANPVAYSFGGKVERFDLVVFKPNQEQIDQSGEQDLLYVFRAIGLPNETIEIKNNQIFINGLLLEEPYEKIIDSKDKMKDLGAIVIPENEYFFLGDNRPDSADSRYWKVPTIKKENVISQIVDIKKDYYGKNENGN